MGVNIAIFLSCGAFWGFSFTLMRIVMLGGGHPLAVAFWHAATASVLVWGVLWLSGWLPRIDARFIRFAATLGFLGGACPSILLFWAAQNIGAGVISVCMATVPLMQIGLSAALGIERFSARRLFGLILGLVAVWLIADPSGGAAPWFWVVVAALGGFSYACEDSFIAMKRPHDLNSAQILAGMMLFYMIYTAPALLFVDPAVLSLTAPGRVEAAFLAMVPGSLLAYGAFVNLISRAGPVFASQVAYVVTVAGVVCGAIILGESYNVVFWFALGLIVVGLALGLPGGWRPRVAPDATPGGT
ncbi:EamA family transporter [Pikeienuella piscinae]|uniref:EamA family transporter n=1 Tax=Pikeienuella piscinae TaxID=2748098 RepID=A0A7L5BXD1_9RHOB|nr:DMT family transporter [Pikeienuella piscinae]QIE54906.1 EamA family transporter [Pikeienuella piscinae]